MEFCEFTAIPGDSITVYVRRNKLSIILYSTGCPKCKVLKSKLVDKNIEFVENNSVETMTGLGITQVPVLSVDGTLFDFKQAVAWVNNN